jgi:hypothetical protein
MREKLQATFAFVAFSIASIVLSNPVHAADITVSLTQPDLSTCTDGSPSATNCPLTGVEIQQKDANGVWQRKEVWTPSQLTAKYTALALGKTYCFRARNQSGTASSDFTPDACVDIAFVSPRAPLGTQVQKVTVTLTSTAAK